MSQRGLEALLRPKSIAVIGASMKPDRAGYLMMRNLLAGDLMVPSCPSRRRIRRFRECLHGLMYRACLSYRIWPYCVQTRNGIRSCWNRSARKAVKPALFSRLRLNRKPSFWPVPAAIKCAFLGQTVSACSPLAGLKCQLLSGTNPQRQARVYLAVGSGIEHYPRLGAAARNGILLLHCSRRQSGYRC